MKSRETILFFDQLSMLVRTGLPLPEGIMELAQTMKHPSSRYALNRLGAEMAGGTSLTEALKHQPAHFSPMQTDLIAVGEQTGMLTEVLHELARHGRQELALLESLRRDLIYPFVTLYLGWLIFSGLLIFVLPDFARMFDEMLAGEPLPPLTNLVIAIMHLARTLLPLVLFSYLALPLLGIWLISGRLQADRAMIKLIRLVPGFHHLLVLNDLARFSGLLGVYLRYRTTLESALRQISRILQTRHLGIRVERWHKQVNAGTTFAQAVSRERSLDPMLALIIRHSPEEELPDALTDLSGVYAQQADVYRQSFSSGLCILLMLFTGLVVGLMVLAMFMPLIKLIDTLVD